jgi:hypothetical protein
MTIEHIFTTKLAVKTTLPQAWDALTTENGLVQWFLSEAKLDLRSGGWGETRFPSKISEVIPQAKFIFGGGSLWVVSHLN